MVLVLGLEHGPDVIRRQLGLGPRSPFPRLPLCCGPVPRQPRQPDRDAVLTEVALLGPGAGTGSREFSAQSLTA